MKKSRMIIVGFLLVLIGCGGSGGDPAASGGNAASFKVVPGVSRLSKGGTLQFSTDPAGIDVSWSVLGAGDAGAIDASGLFSAPAKLPLNALITVQAERNGEKATAQVQLYTGETISLGQTRQVNGAAIPDVVLLAELDQNQGMGVADRIGVRAGSLHVEAAWNIKNGNNGYNLAFAFSTDLGAFSPEQNLAADPNKNQQLSGLLTDQEGDPGVFFTDFSGSKALLFRKGREHGSSFNSPVQVVTPGSGNREFCASAKADQGNRYHVAFLEEDSQIRLRYYRSDDQGKTWQPGGGLLPPPVSNGDSFPNLALSPDGSEVLICYMRGNASSTDVYLAKSVDGGTVFSAPVNVSQSGGKKGHCRVARGPQGEVYVAYAEGDPKGDQDILLKKSTDGGITFGSAKKVHQTQAGRQNFPFLSVDALDRIDVVYGDDLGQNAIMSKRLFHARSTDGGQNFSETEIATLDGFSVPLGLVHDEAGRLHLLFADMPDGDNKYNIFLLMGE
ncbi:MAG: exo-alpha-sialidase [Deltaproteobacteria bacterium]|nr:exo-alpha-sialidase [Deltaproteobacteria bacterium]